MVLDTSIVILIVLLAVVVLGFLLIRKDWFKIKLVRSFGHHMARNQRSKLAFSIVIDLAGMVSYIIPGALEVLDVPWGIVSRELVRGMYGSNILANFNFLEEELPFTDIIPTATLGYFLEKSGHLQEKRGQKVDIPVRHR